MKRTSNGEILRVVIFDLVKFMNDGEPGHRNGIHRHLMTYMEEILDEAEDEYFNRT